MCTNQIIYVIIIIICSQLQHKKNFGPSFHIFEFFSLYFFLSILSSLLGKTFEIGLSNFWLRTTSLVAQKWIKRILIFTDCFFEPRPRPRLRLPLRPWRPKTFPPKLYTSKFVSIKMRFVQKFSNSNLVSIR